MGTAPRIERRSERRPHKVEVTLLGKMRGLEFTQPAHTINVSDGGLSIITDGPLEPSRPLAPGQIIYVYGAGSFRLGYCKVVWVLSGKPEAPSSAGLQFLI